MNKDKLKEALSAILQYGWMWGNPRHLSTEQWSAVEDAYKDLNGGKAFKPDKTKRATQV
jgi:hypothetical protein